jgi:hypothetical protein
LIGHSIIIGIGVLEVGDPILIGVPGELARSSLLFIGDPVVVGVDVPMIWGPVVILVTSPFLLVRNSIAVTVLIQVVGRSILIAVSDGFALSGLTVFFSVFNTVVVRVMIGEVRDAISVCIPWSLVKSATSLALLHGHGHSVVVVEPKGHRFRDSPCSDEREMDRFRDLLIDPFGSKLNTHTGFGWTGLTTFFKGGALHHLAGEKVISLGRGIVSDDQVAFGQAAAPEFHVIDTGFPTKFPTLGRKGGQGTHRRSHTDGQGAKRADGTQEQSVVTRWELS